MLTGLRTEVFSGPTYVVPTVPGVGCLTTWLADPDGIALKLWLAFGPGIALKLWLALGPGATFIAWLAFGPGPSLYAGIDPVLLARATGAALAASSSAAKNCWPLAVSFRRIFRQRLQHYF